MKDDRVYLIRNLQTLAESSQRLSDGIKAHPVAPSRHVSARS